MTIAFILINTVAGTESLVLSKLKAISSIKDAYIVYGVYDVIVKIETDSIRPLKKTVLNKIRKINEVTSTTTLIV